MTSTLTLSAGCLFSKWGFNDGDVPDWLLDWATDHPGEGVTEHQLLDVWHDVLRALVRGLLAPYLPDDLVLVDIETIHNPIRADQVYGEQIPWDEGEADMPGGFNQSMQHRVVEASVVAPRIPRLVSSIRGPCGADC